MNAVYGVRLLLFFFLCFKIVYTLFFVFAVYTRRPQVPKKPSKPQGTERPPKPAATASERKRRVDARKAEGQQRQEAQLAMLSQVEEAPRQEDAVPQPDIDESEEVEAASSSSRRRKGQADDEILRGPFPGGPHDPSLLPSFLGHVAADIWNGKEDRPVLRCYNHTSKFNKWEYAATAATWGWRRLFQRSKL